MPWCPKCKNEYREGITRCSECDVDLVDELTAADNKEILFTSPSHDTTEKFVAFMEHEGLTDYQIVENEFGDEEILVPESKLEQAKKLMIGFAVAMESNIDTVSNPDEVVVPSDEEQDDVEEEKGKEILRELRNSKSSIYVKTADKYNDFKFSGYSFLGFAILGFIFIILNVLKILTLMTTFSIVTMLILFVIFTIIGIHSLIMASRIKANIGEEETLTDKINQWMKERFTDEYFTQLGESESSEEKRYFIYLENMLQDAVDEFPKADDSLIEELTDNYLNDYLA